MDVEAVDVAELRVDEPPSIAETAERDGAAEATVHALLLRLAGAVPDDLLGDAREWLAAGRRLDVAQVVAFEAISQPLPLDADEIGLLRIELARGEADSDLALALEELRGERQPTPWMFLSALPETDEQAALMVRPLDLTGPPDEDTAAVDVDAVDHALLAEAKTFPGVRAVWRVWRMPPSARPWLDPVRVAVVTVEDTVEALPELAVRLRKVMAGAGDTTAQAEICWAGFDAPFYQTMARSCGALLWAHRPIVPVTTARVFDGVDPERGPWFTTHHPVVAAGPDRETLVAALRTGMVIAWSSARMVDVLAPDGGDVVPLHLRTDGVWVWSEAVTYYLEQYGLAPDPDLVAHLTRPEPAEPLDEISVHRAFVHLYQRSSDEAAWSLPDADDADEDQKPSNPWRTDVTAEEIADDGTDDVFDVDLGGHRPVLP